MRKNGGKVEVLIDETFKRFNIEFLELNDGSHKKVVVRCHGCGETFLRERRLLHQFHYCPTHIAREDGEKLKWCNCCKMFLTYECFSKNRARTDNMNSMCATCFNNSKSKNQSDLKKTSLDAWMVNFLKSKRSLCKKRGTPLDIDIEYLMELWHKQNGCCYYSNIIMLFDSKSIRSASLERLDPSKGYIEGNIAWASKAMNWSNNSSEEEFALFLSEISPKSVRLEYKLLDKKAKPPFRKRVTDAGYDIASIENIIIKPGESVDIKTGIAVAAPEGHYFTVDGRSSMSQNGIIPFRGIIDNGYCGHLMIALSNISDKAYEIIEGDRIAQIILHKQYHADFSEVRKFGFEYSQRGKDGCDGFGSSGKQ